MARYPLSVLEGSAADAFGAVLRHHLPVGSRVLDPTFGEGLSWGPALLEQYTVQRTDLRPPWEQDLFSLLHSHPEYEGAFDAVFYDPPYLIGAARTSDPRTQTYGGYDGDEGGLQRFMEAIEDPLRRCLRPGGKIIVKCGDQYVPKLRRFRPWHFYWMQHILSAGLDLIDLYIYRYHRVSPTAFQVKDRPCAVIAHTYFLIGHKP